MLVVALPPLVFGQPRQETRSPNTLGLHFGLHTSQTQDLLYSPFVYRGRSLLTAQVYYERRTRNGLHLLSASIDDISIESTAQRTGTITRKASTASMYSIHYGYARAVVQRGNFSMLLGGLLDSQFHLVGYQFLASDDEGYLLSYALTAWGRGHYRLDQKHALRLDTSFPLVSFVSRPPYSLVYNEEIQSDTPTFFFIHKRGRVELPGAYTKWHLSLQYSYDFSSTVSLTVSYQFDYIRFSEPQRIAILRNGFDAGFAFTF